MMLPTLPDLLRTVLEKGGSDLHLAANSPPLIRIDGDLRPTDLPILQASDTKQLAYSILTDAQKKRFEETMELDFAFGITGIARFRGNLFNQRGATGAVYRLIPEAIRTFGELGLPAVIATLAERPRGLVLVTGPTGSGKSTTLAAMIDKINAERHAHILTIEDPIEFIHNNQNSLINQRGRTLHGRRRARGAGRWDGDSSRGPGRPVPAVPRHVRQGERSRAGDRPPDRHRLRRGDSGEFEARCRDHGVRAPARPRGGGRMSGVAESTTATDGVDRRAPRILVVDDERSMRELLAIVLRREGYEVLLAESGRSAIELLERERVDLLISDIKMPDVSGVEVLRAAKRIDQDILGIMITAFASTDTAVEAMRLGACDYLSKPFDIDLLKMKVREKIENRQLRQENVLLKRTLGLAHQFSNIVGRSEAMLAVFKMIETVARTNSTILLTGESGTGKGLAATAIQFNSLRRDKPMVSLNCGAVPEALLESELFGHMRGAFTSADSNKKGLIEVAEKGTIFLDEIGEMPAAMQVKLLRVLQERRFRRVGGVEELQADIRVIAATNQDLAKLVSEGRFREDLYYRINVIPIAMPALRDRREDLPLLAVHFLGKYAEQMGKNVSVISHEAMEQLKAYDWPGNIRELENVIERAVALEATPAILPDSLPAHLRTERGASPVGPADAFPDEGFDLEAHVQGIEKSYIAEALKRADGVQVKAAELLGMSFRSFRYYVKKYQLR